MSQNIELDIQILVVIISRFTYGLVFLLSLSCFRLLYQKLGQNSESTSKRTNRFLLLYTAFVASLDTVSLIGEIVSIMSPRFTWTNIPDYIALRPPLGIAIVILPLAIWSADGFMVRSRNSSSLRNVNQLFR